MSKRQRWIGGMALAAGAFVGATIVMVARHSESGQGIAPVRAEIIAPQVAFEHRVTRAIREADVAINRLDVRILGDIVILRGNGDAETAQRAVTAARSAGATRIANLITPIRGYDDDNIRREAERELAGNGSLAGCTLRVQSENGVLRVTGTIQHELQRDVARNALRTVRGAREVQVDLTRL